MEKATKAEVSEYLHALACSIDMEVSRRGVIYQIWGTGDSDPTTGQLEAKAKRVREIANDLWENRGAPTVGLQLVFDGCLKNLPGLKAGESLRLDEPCTVIVAEVRP